MIFEISLQRSAQGLQGTSTTGGQGIIWLDDVQCTGSETSLAQCRRTSFDIGFANCGHSEDARVICHKWLQSYYKTPLNAMQTVPLYRSIINLMYYEKIIIRLFKSTYVPHQHYMKCVYMINWSIMKQKDHTIKNSLNVLITHLHYPSNS